MTLELSIIELLALRIAVQAAAENCAEEEAAMLEALELRLSGAIETATEART